MVVGLPVLGARSFVHSVSQSAVALFSGSIVLASAKFRDTLTWHYSTGMPKSKSLGHALRHKSNSTVATALSPSQETIIVARKPLERGKGFAANA